MLSLFFSEHGPHRDLHSFPTRRSSDLIRRFGSRCASGTDKKRATVSSSKPEARLFIACRTGGTTIISLHSRSEEHTSELQSRRDLVCRLLLEKKKNMYTSCKFEPSTTN